MSKWSKELVVVDLESVSKHVVETSLSCGSLFELLHDALVQIVAEVLHRAAAHLKNNGGGVVRQLAFGLCVAV